MTLSLPDVTLCAVTAINHELTVRAMKECLRHCTFGDVVLISDKPIDAPFRVEIMPPFSDGWQYAPFICHNLGRYTSTAFNLLVQYDSYVVDPSAWNPVFLEYDYIGAKWPWRKGPHRVGNSGFCLRSKKLLDLLAQTPLPPAGQFVDDELICITMRGMFEQKFGIKIAPENIADQFAYERHVPEQPVFGVHGIFNFWRHKSDAEMEEFPALMDKTTVTGRPYMEVVLNSYAAGKTKVFSRWYRRLRDEMSKDHIRNYMMYYVRDAAFVDGLIAAGDS